MRLRLEREQRALEASPLLTQDLPENTTAAKFVDRFSSLTEPDDVKTLGTLSENEIRRLKLIKKQIFDLKATDPAKIEQELRLRGKRLGFLAQHLRKLDTALSPQTVKSASDAKNHMQSKQGEARQLRQMTFLPVRLPGTGSDNWRGMWEAGRRFSQGNAYPDWPFPFIGDGARCVLCQQDLEPDTTLRLKQFEEFVSSRAEQDFRTASNEFDRIHKDLDNLIVSDRETEQTLRDLRIEDESLAQKASNTLLLVAQNHTAIIEALAGRNTQFGELTELPSIAQEVEILSDQLSVRAEALKEGMSEGKEEVLTADLEELKARQALRRHEEAVLAEIERKKRIAAYGLCLADTRTQGITTKSSSVTKVAVTQQLKTAFQEELQKLNFRHVEVELKEAGGQTGNFYHQLILTRAPGVELPKVVSEGEARFVCLSLRFLQN